LTENESGLQQRLNLNFSYLEGQEKKMIPSANDNKREDLMYEQNNMRIANVTSPMMKMVLD
jgi:hypothetical protein